MWIPLSIVAAALLQHASSRDLPHTRSRISVLVASTLFFLAAFAAAVDASGVGTGIASALAVQMAAVCGFALGTPVAPRLTRATAAALVLSLLLAGVL